MIGAIGPGGVGPLTSVRAATGGSRTRAGAAMVALAGRVAATFAREFDLLGDDRPRRGQDADPYDVKATARDLNLGLGGGAVDEGRFIRSLGEFVSESASLLWARPESRSLEQVADAVAAAEAEQRGPESVEGALRSIDRGTALVAGQVRR